MTATISVLIPCYNAEAFIGDAIASVLAQTHAAVECIVIDDASTDGSRELVRRIAAGDGRVKPIELAVNGGPARARQTGLDAATGAWVTFLDSDDLYERDRLERLLRLAERENATAVVDNQSVRNFPDGGHLYDGFRFLTGPDPIPLPPEAFFEAEANPGTYLKAGYMKPMIDLAWLRRNGIGYDERFRIAEDFLFYGEMFAAGARCVGTSYAGYIYRRRTTSISRSNVVDLLQIASVSDELIRKHAARLSARSLAAIRKREADLERFAALNGARDRLRQKDPVGAVRALAGRPDCVLLLGRIVRRRLAVASRKADF